MKQLTILAAIIMATALTACSKPAATPDTMTDQPPAGAAGMAGGNPTAEKAARQIQGDYMRGIVAEISDDRYEGRGPGTRGDVAARKYLAEQMAALGLQPGAENDTWSNRSTWSESMRRNRKPGNSKRKTSRSH